MHWRHCKPAAQFTGRHSTKLFIFPVTYITASLILPKNSVVKHQERNWIMPKIAFHHSHPLTAHSAMFPSLPQCSEQSLPIAAVPSKAVRPTGEEHLFLNRSLFIHGSVRCQVYVCGVVWPCPAEGVHTFPYNKERGLGLNKWRVFYNSSLL